MLPRKRISHYGFDIFIVGIFSSISSILFYKNRLNLSKVMVFSTLGFILSDFPFVSVVSHLTNGYLSRVLNTIIADKIVMIKIT